MTVDLLENWRLFGTERLVPMAFCGGHILWFLQFLSQEAQVVTSICHIQWTGMTPQNRPPPPPINVAAISWLQLWVVKLLSRWCMYVKKCCYLECFPNMATQSVQTSTAPIANPIRQTPFFYLKLLKLRTTLLKSATGLLKSHFSNGVLSLHQKHWGLCVLTT